MVWKRRKEPIYVKLEQPSLNRGGGLRHHLSPNYNSVLSSLQTDTLKTIHTWTHLALETHMKPSQVNDPSGPNNFETQSSDMSLTTL